ncbi:MAG: hypothetical protein UY23_C0001G0368 [Candidatus Jorgensenbacteria bacterium GW2011_GWA1_48_11]|uniref:Uncharacterized protein n=1 Tax=Candidatus Jorgensenbacteria bacterium GW2011_GWA1_48_11 TaxID=1618660 RepID=A0A0G1UCB6_9BACT|nr:MAG: hypothetical protein UY23_C0001G0368 [Candidatus Jorgensenbacteria bacterium GW2011_GWA1_48_11]KKW12253.1 MAG: hypothetical protein UY51_C0005G0495 [Candidatus Jorgensenbacteria bacterium GW2011_GWB1_49_9]
MKEELIGLVLLLVYWGVFVAVVVYPYFRQRRETEALRRTACTLMGLPPDTSIKELREMHRKMTEK